jgi:hypothetical protein
MSKLRRNDKDVSVERLCGHSMFLLKERLLMVVNRAPLLLWLHRVVG